ncbi:MAG: DNA polymerase I, partial [candidate division Zixibacteria bacterium]|nr:DNA polymerase I [candidate division Zixibacteria bacterium]
MAEKLVLIDGTALAYRSFYAFIRNPLISSKGENTSTSFGFINSIQKLKREYKPEYMAVSFDLGAPTVRHKIYPEYKSTRAKMPDEMVDTLPRLNSVVEAMNLPVVAIEGIEADDIIGTLAVKGAEEGLDVYIYTGDKDFFQLVNDRISIIYPGKKGEDDKVLDAKGVEKKFGVPPDKVIDVLALMGDSSDNIPGVPGIGPKTANQLIKEIGGFEKIYQSLDSITKKKLKEKLEENREQAILSRDLVTIKTDIDVDKNIHDLKVSEPDLGKLLPLLKELEFGRFVEEFSGKVQQKNEVEYKLIQSIEELKKVGEEIHKVGCFAIDTETSSLVARHAELVGISISFEEHRAYYIPVGHIETDSNLPVDDVLDVIRELCEDKSILKAAQNLKYDLQVFRNRGMEKIEPAFDTMLASYVINASARGHGLSALALRYFDYNMQSITELIGTGKKQKSFAEVPVEDAVFYACEDADITYRLYKRLEPEIENNDLRKVFGEIEMPLIEVLREMEESGVRVDPEKLKEISDNLNNELERLTEEIYKHTDEEFNINSPVQLQKVLFEELGLPSKGKTAKGSGYSTDASVLEELARIHELPKLILEYRELTKLKSTYSDALVELIDERTDRIHTSFNQAVTATGRLSSSDPNLQNIPVRTELGREVREAFIPSDEEHIFLSADYSQVELRLMAHIADDEKMIEAFRRGEDIHNRTAAEIYGVEID